MKTILIPLGRLAPAKFLEFLLIMALKSYMKINNQCNYSGIPESSDAYVRFCSRCSSAAFNKLASHQLLLLQLLPSRHLVSPPLAISATPPFCRTIFRDVFFEVKVALKKFCTGVAKLNNRAPETSNAPVPTSVCFSNLITGFT